MSDRPDITHAQVAAPVSAVASAIAVVEQAPVRLQLPLLIIIGVLAGLWLVSDAYLRGKRNDAASATVLHAVATLQSKPADGDDSLVPQVK